MNSSAGRFWPTLALLLWAAGGGGCWAPPELAQAGLALQTTNVSLASLCGQVDHMLAKAQRPDLTSIHPSDVLPYAECLASLYDVLNGTKALQMWALKMIDASSKIQSGLIKGNLMDFGQYDECVEIERPSYVGQHCLVQLVLSMPGLSNYTINMNGEEYKLSDILGGSSLTLTSAICLPSSCKPFMIEKGFQEILIPLNKELESKNVTVTAIVADKDCHLKSRGPIATEDWVVIVVCGIIVAFTVTATLVHLFLIKGNKSSSANKVILAFSLKANATKLFSTKGGGEQMSAINGIKFFSIAWVVLGHRYRYSVVQPVVNLADIPTMIQDWTKMFLLNATLSVETFFLISGLLNAYGFFTLMSKKRRYTPIDWIVSYVHRYIRLTPAYMLMIAVTATWLYRVGDGPIWDRMVGTARENCQQYWWANIIYLNNYLFPDTYCMMQSWYLAADMQMFWLAPFVLYPLWRWPIFGLVELLILLCLSIASPLAITMVFGITQPIPLSRNPEVASKEMAVLYLPTHTKTIAYVVGIFAGYLLYKARNKKLKLPFNLISLIIGWVVCAVFLLYALFGCYWLFQTNNPYTQLESSLYLAFYKLFWSIGLSWLIIACVMGHGGIVNTILSWKGFGPLGRLTYCVYLTHIAILLYKMASIRTTYYLEDFNEVEEFLGDFFFSLLAAIILTLTLESPILTLEKMVFGGVRENKKVEQPTPMKQMKHEEEGVS